MRGYEQKVRTIGDRKRFWQGRHTVARHPKGLAHKRPGAEHATAAMIACTYNIFNLLLLSHREHPTDAITIDIFLFGVNIGDELAR